MQYQEIEGDLIKLAKEGKFDVIAHGCNCQCIMGAGLAPQMAKAFGADKFELEREGYKGDMNKLGTIDYQPRIIHKKEVYHPKGINLPQGKTLIITNCYTQFDITGRKVGKIDLDYSALELCLKKMNHVFKGKHIGLPLIGGGLAGGNPDRIKQMIKDCFIDCNVTLVNYQK